MSKKHIVIIGLGGVGGYFGFKISQQNETNKQHKISFIARAKTYQTVQKQGLTLLSAEHYNPVTHPDAIHQSISEIQNPDLILICVKEYDLEAVCIQLSSILSDHTQLLPMMNGADIYDRIRKIIPNHTILPSCVYVASHIKEKGVVEHKGKPGKLIFGKDPSDITAIAPPNKSSDINWIIDLMDKSKIHFEFKENALLDIWTKFIFIASFGLVTAKYNSSIGAVCSITDQKEEATKIMREIKAIADAKNIGLPDHIIANTFEKAASFPPKTPTSLQLDVHSKKKENELSLFADAIINYGKELNINTPETAHLYTELKKDQT